MSNKEIKIQAYRDFADRLRTRKRAVRTLDFCDEFWTSAVLAEDIENTLIEMVSEIDVTCRNCHRTEKIPITNYFDYCPHCGAKMDGERKDEE